MQESLFETVRKLQEENKINVEELEALLKSDIEEVVTLCKKACLKPKTDSMGNAYFTRDDVNMLKKMKELYTQSKRIENDDTKDDFDSVNEPNNRFTKKINFLDKSKSRTPSTTLTSEGSAFSLFQNKMENFENNLIKKMGDLLSEKMDGFDEIIVELIRAKTENESLRGQINGLNKEVFHLKNELASFSPLALGLYVKKDNEEL